MNFSKRYTNSNLLLLMVVPPVGHLGKQMFVKYVEFNGIAGMSFVIHFKILPSNKLMPSTTLTI